MQKKLLQFGKLTLVLSLLFALGGCTEEKYYPVVEDPNEPSAYWEILNYTIDSKPGKDGIWKWDAEARRFFCDVRVPEMSEYIYDEGALIGYVFFGTLGEDESQVLLPLHQMLPNGKGVNISCDYSFDLNQSIRFYFYWDDYADFDPGLYNFRVVFIY